MPLSSATSKERRSTAVSSGFGASTSPVVRRSVERARNFMGSRRRSFTPNSTPGQRISKSRHSLSGYPFSHTLVNLLLGRLAITILKSGGSQAKRNVETFKVAANNRLPRRRFQRRSNVRANPAPSPDLTREGRRPPKTVPFRSEFSFCSVILLQIVIDQVQAKQHHWDTCIPLKMITFRSDSVPLRVRSGHVPLQIVIDQVQAKQHHWTAPFLRPLSAEGRFRKSWDLLLMVRRLP